MSGFTFLPEHYTFIQDNVIGATDGELAGMFNKRFGQSLSSGQIKSFKRRNGLRSGLGNRFAANNICDGYKPRASFPKGNTPYNYLLIGSERINSQKYIEVKIGNPNIWKLKHHIVWKECNGPLKEGNVLIFGDGDKTNCTAENIIEIERGLLGILSNFNLILDNVDHTKVGVNIAKLIRATNKVESEAKRGTRGQYERRKSKND